MPDLPDFQLRRPDPKPPSFAEAHPFAPTGWAPEAKPGGAAPSFAEAHPFAPTGWDPTPKAAPGAAAPATSAAPAAAPAPVPGLYTEGMTDLGRANARANAGIYDAGTDGAINAQANGTGVVVQPGSTDLMPGIRALRARDAAKAAPTAATPATPGGGDGAAPASTVRSFTGSRPDAMALARGLGGEALSDPATGAIARPGKGRLYPAGGMLAPGTGLAMAGSDLAAGLEADRTYQREIAPIMTTLTPRLTPDERRQQIGAAADAQRLTTPPPELAASRLGAIDQMILRTAGKPVAESSGAQVQRGTDAAGRPTLSTNTMTRGRDGRGVLDLARALPTSAYDQNRKAVETLAASGRAAQVAASQPGLRDFGKGPDGKPVMGLVSPTGNVTLIKDRQAAGSQLDKLIRERDAWKAQGRDEVVAQYDQVISNYGQKYDAFGNPITAKPAATPAAGPAKAATQTTPAPAKPGAGNPADQQALEWARANPTDPRSAAILSRLKG